MTRYVEISRNAQMFNIELLSASRFLWKYVQLHGSYENTVKIMYGSQKSGRKWPSYIRSKFWKSSWWVVSTVSWEVICKSLGIGDHCLRMMPLGIPLTDMCLKIRRVRFYSDSKRCTSGFWKRYSCKEYISMIQSNPPEENGSKNLWIPI